MLASEMRYRENRVEYWTQTWFDDSLPSLSPDICLLLQSKLMGRVVSGTLLPVNWKTARELPAGGRVAEGDGGGKVFPPQMKPIVVEVTATWISEACPVVKL